MGFLDRFRRKGREAEESLDELVGRLAGGDPSGREGAARRIGARGTDARAALPALERTLADPVGTVRAAAADAVIKAGGDAEHALAVLIELLGDPDASARRAAAAELGKQGERAEPGVAALVRTLGDREDEVAAAAADALFRIGQPVVKPLIEALRTANDAVRRHAMTTLTRVAPAAIPTLIQYTDHEDATVRMIAALGLQDLIPAEETLDAVLEALRSGDWLLRAFAARTLGLLGPEVEGPAAPPLESALSDPHPEVRAAATEALARIRPT